MPTYNNNDRTTTVEHYIYYYVPVLLPEQIQMLCYSVACVISPSAHAHGHDARAMYFDSIFSDCFVFHSIFSLFYVFILPVVVACGRFDSRSHMTREYSAHHCSPDARLHKCTAAPNGIEMPAVKCAPHSTLNIHAGTAALPKRE